LQSNFVHTSVRNAFFAFSLVIYYEFIMGRSKKDPYSPAEEISAVRRGRGEKIVSDNSKCIRTSEGGRGVNFLFPPWEWYGCFLE
jgi:hypothetical protein